MNRELLKARLGKLPRLPPLDNQDGLDSGLRELDDEEEREELIDSFPTSDLEQQQLRPQGRVKRRRGPSSRQDLSPLSAEGYFAQALQVRVPVTNLYPPSPSSSRVTTASSSSSSSATPVTADFRVYYTAPSTSRGREENDEETSSNGVVFVCVHGAGYSGLSYACTARELVSKGHGKIGVLSFDARGHGKTNLPDPDEEGEQASLELSAMAQDLISLLKTMFPERGSAPAIVLVGHSMGGAVVAEACNRIQDSVADVLGVTVIDVVEGTALEALSSMSTLIASQPKIFESKEAAIGWHLDSRTINNVTSARISVPSLVRPQAPRAQSTTTTGAEDQGGGDKLAAGEKYAWTVDLSKTEPYWKGWFTGLSSKFLSCRTAKLLILAGTDRLDKELLIGQMQGKYQLEVFPEAGHCLHEDLPERTAETLLHFWERNDRTDVLKGVQKIGSCQ